MSLSLSAKAPLSKQLRIWEKGPDFNVLLG